MLSFPKIVPYTSGINDCMEQQRANRDPRAMDKWSVQCNSDGSYKRTQRYGFLGTFWCVDVETGEEIPNSRARGPVNCDRFPAKGI